MASTQLESELHASYWEDGLLDLFCGVALLMIGTAWWFELHVFGPISLPLLVPLWQPFRKRWIEPRAGYVEFSPSRRHRWRTSLHVVLLCGLGTFVLAVLMYVLVQKNQNVVPADFVAGLPALLLGLGGFFVVLLTSQIRFLAYTFVLICAGITTIAIDAGPAAPLIVSGMIVLAAGVLLLTRFFRESKGLAQ
ncbi:MAG: hypothetical protein QGI68_02220 [Pseudomonadales bacterium]|jgi:hypothetical protein|nr:hypothetical protein [Pseudomonadales bacterium]MDP7144221.1 hypothetical protein [Pseudomonadales bacterium]MDP7358852.1 hypothetical protein [Pseudomonadales bacterium]MDP7594368.1 hypothetical protein [Pseudomonadales bacterium]HJN49077.1 hypothetical protein [Pseudomonadales bacterium]|tara:strand:+ start:859 stop:1437 length:579 start_codon:yes stop_codon:yes gene_type:complete